MDLSTALAVASVICGIGAALLGQRGRDYLGLGAFVTGTLALLALLIITFVGFAALAGLNQFGLMHLIYLVVVIGVPVMGVTIGLVARFYKRGTNGLGVLIFLSLIPIGVGLYGTHVEPNNLRVDAHRLEVAGMERVIRVGVLADLQTDTVGEYENKAVDEILAANPQIVVVPGDLWHMPAEEYALREPEFVELVRRLTNAVEVVVLVEGDNDDLAGLTRIAEFTGAVLLKDEVLELQFGAQQVVIAGITQENNSLETLMGHLSALDPATLTILLSHWPDVVESFPDIGGTDLVIAGHTHGGQVSIPGFGPLITHTDVPRNVAAGGLHRVGERNIYVSTGVGIERGQAPQVRLGVRPSVGVLDIVPS